MRFVSPIYVDGSVTVATLTGNTVVSPSQPAGSGSFSLETVSVTAHNQKTTKTHSLYDDTTAGGTITVSLLAVGSHSGVTTHKKIGNSHMIVLSAPSGVTIDGQSSYNLTTQYESVGVYTDGTNYFIQ
jgi:hypothetical protein